LTAISFKIVSWGTNTAIPSISRGFSSEFTELHVKLDADTCLDFVIHRRQNETRSRKSTRVIRKEMFPVYYSVKWLGREMLSRRSTVAEDARPGGEVSGTTVKRLLYCGFRRVGKAMGRVYHCWWRICREINVFFQVRISHILHFVSVCDSCV
jgi:hypothetical protein